MEEYYEFDCGCKFKILDSKVNKDGFPSMEYDFYNLRNCNKVWDLLETGNTKGVFQLESQLGQTWCEKFKPKSIDEIAILTSIVRPGTLESEFDGKTVAQHFVDRKQGLEECTPMHPALGNILEETYNLSCFQEQSIQIVRDIAGFDEGLGETFRKGVSKKKSEIIAELKPKFIQGCIDKGLTEKDGEEIYDILEKSERYGFNRSISRETLVELKNGCSKYIDELTNKDVIKTPTGYARVIAVFDHGKMNSYRVTLSNGFHITCSIQHKFLCQNNEIKPIWEILCNNDAIVTESGKYFISNIEVVGIKNLYDIEIDSEDHIFYGNGIATSNSHATIYSYLTYATCYAKVHFSALFFTSWLHDSKEKIDPTEERRDLIADAKRFNIQICSPTLEFISEGLGSEFFNTRDKVYFGLVDIKGIGYSEIKKLETEIKLAEKVLNKNVMRFTWFEFLCLVASKLKKTVVNNLILVGSTPGIEYRKRMLLEYKVWEKLNDKETTWIINNYGNYNSLSNSLREYIKVDKKDGGPYNSASVKKLNSLIDTIEKVSYNTNDDPAWVSANEVHLMGVSLSSHVLDDYDISGDTTCKEMYDGKDSGTICAQITAVRETVTKNGKNPGQKMCFVKFEDQTDSIDGVCFPNVFLKDQDIIYIGSVVVASVKKGQGKGVIVNSLSKA